MTTETLSLWASSISQFKKAQLYGCLSISHNIQCNFLMFLSTHYIQCKFIYIYTHKVELNICARCICILYMHIDSGVCTYSFVQDHVEGNAECHHKEDSNQCKLQKSVQDAVEHENVDAQQWHSL